MIKKLQKLTICKTVDCLGIGNVATKLQLLYISSGTPIFSEKAKQNRGSLTQDLPITFTGKSPPPPINFKEGIKNEQNYNLNTNRLVRFVNTNMIASIELRVITGNT